MAADKSTGKRPLPPYPSASTFLATIESWRPVRPSSVNRGVLTRVAGSMQTWIIATLRYFDLIDENNVPTPKLDRLATASDTDRPKLLAEMLREGYPYLFTKGVDIANITQSDLKQKFVDAGAQGETATKAMSFFTAMAKAAELKLSPYVATRQRRSNGSSTRRAARKADAKATPAPPPPMHQHGGSKTPFEVLYELLDPEGMSTAEQDAVWTLLRFIRKAGR